MKGKGHRRLSGDLFKHEETSLPLAEANIFVDLIQ